MSGRLEGKVAFITGAARGQGRAHAVKLAQEGADIIAIDLAGPIPLVPYDSPTMDDLHETVRLVEALDRRILFEQGDVRDLASMRAFVDKSVAELAGSTSWSRTPASASPRPGTRPHPKCSRSRWIRTSSACGTP